MDLLRAFLGSLPRGTAGNVARAVEMDRMNDGQVLPHELILESLRPSLREDDTPERAPTPLRLFCRPFEDLLVSGASPKKQKGRIARGSITPVWNWLSQDLIPASATAYSLAVKTAAMVGGEVPELPQKVSEFWATASAALRNRLAAETGRRTARQVLGNDTAVEDAREMALMLAAAPEICELQDALPRTMPSLTEEAIQAYRAAHEKLAARMPDAAPYLSIVVMNRLEQPWEALRLAPAAAGHAESGDEPVSIPDLGLAGELLLAAIDAHRAAIAFANPEQFEGDAFVKHLEGYQTVLNGVTRELELRRDGVRIQQLANGRARVDETVGNFVARAPQEIFAALSLQVAENGALTMDFTHPVDPDKCCRGASYARLIEGCRPLAAGAPFESSLKLADSQVNAVLKRYNEAIVRELGHADDEKRPVAEQYAIVATDITAILAGLEHNGRPRQQAHNSMGTSIAA